MEQFLLLIFLPFLIAFAVVAVLHPKLVKIALNKSIVDNPNARKLNKEPVPVLGGIGIFFGIVISVAICSVLNDFTVSFVAFTAMIIMLYTGAVDDIVEIKAIWKLVLQIIAVAMLMWLGGFRADSLHGLWGIWQLPAWVWIPLTLVAGVGMINAINLLDGVDGLSSGYTIMATIVSGIAFLYAGNVAYVVASFAIAGSVVPFFVHNCFGRKYKMYMGDGGSLTMGIIFAIILMKFINSGSQLPVKGVVSFMVALFSVPVFDTIRVMSMRMVKGKSPFSPDKTHLHHIFINMGFNHPATSSIVVFLNVLALCVWFVTERIYSISVNMQFYIVLVSSILIVWGSYFVISWYCRFKPDRFESVRNDILTRQYRRNDGILRTIRIMLDKL